MAQKKDVEWMPLPEYSGSCPPGLEYLLQVDQLLVHQKIELLEVVTGWEQANKYAIKNSMGQQVYFATEESTCCQRQCCGPHRELRMKIADNNGKEIISLRKPLRCDPCCCCDDWRPYLEVESPPGTIVGYVKSEGMACLHPTFMIMDGDMKPIFRVHTPICGLGCCECEPKYPVKTLDGVEVGLIQKQWAGLTKELFTDADNFGISFPMDLDVKMKATCLGALFLIDYVFFEQKQNNNGGGGGGY